MQKYGLILISKLEIEIILQSRILLLIFNQRLEALIKNRKVTVVSDVLVKNSSMRLYYMIMIIIKKY